MKQLSYQNGVAAIEFALLLIPLTILAFGIAEYGRAMYQYNTITKATRDAARYLSMQAPGNVDAQAAARNLVVCGQIVCTRPSENQGDPDIPIGPLVTGLTAEKVIVRDSSSNSSTHALQLIPAVGGVGAGIANLVTVEVSGFEFVSLVSFVAPNITFGPIGTTMLGSPPS